MACGPGFKFISLLYNYNMERRELIKMITLATGVVFIGGGLLTGCKPDAVLGGATFSEDDILFLDEVADTILPATKTPGTREAKAGAFMQVMVNDTYELKDQKIFHKGIAKLNDACKKVTKKPFMEANSKERTTLLIDLDNEAKAYAKSKKENDPNHYFTMMKQLTLFGFFTSKVGATQALRYVAVPGKYDGNVTYKKGDKAWAT